MNYLKAACEHLGVDPERVLSHHVYEDHIALVVDNGIKGCPKHKVPLSELIVILEAGEHILDDENIPEDVRIVGTEEPNATKGARDLAAEYGFSLLLIKGTGTGGRITKRDVQEVIDAEY